MQSLSPGRAPWRRTARLGGASPVTCTVMESGPLMVSPPTKLTPASSARAKKPLQKPATHASSISGNVKLSSAHRGRAPMADKSDKLTAKMRKTYYSAEQPYGQIHPYNCVTLHITYT